MLLSIKKQLWIRASVIEYKESISQSSDWNVHDAALNSLKQYCILSSKIIVSYTMHYRVDSSWTRKQKCPLLSYNNQIIHPRYLFFFFFFNFNVLPSRSSWKDLKSNLKNMNKSSIIIAHYFSNVKLIFIQSWAQV